MSDEDRTFLAGLYRGHPDSPANQPGGVTTPRPCPFCEAASGLSFEPDGMLHRVACDCGARGPDARDERRAVTEWNARGDLEAAAPAMLAALEDFLAIVDQTHGHAEESDRFTAHDWNVTPWQDEPAVAAARAALAKARGES